MLSMAIPAFTVISQFLSPGEYLSFLPCLGKIEFALGGRVTRWRYQATTK